MKGVLRLGRRNLKKRKEVKERKVKNQKLQKERVRKCSPMPLAAAVAATRRLKNLTPPPRTVTVVQTIRATLNNFDVIVIYCNL